MDTLSIAKELEQLPNNLKQEVFDFIAFLKSKKISNSKNKAPKFGSLKGKIKMQPNFDEPMKEFNDYV
ncbi:MAG: DUF2281 domain-containing protein [Bacteroidota bacterium]|jgi:hypothetical protein